MATDSGRISRIEGIIEKIRNGLNGLDARINGPEQRINVLIRLTSPFWLRLGLPSFVVLSLPDLGLLESIEGVE